MLPLEPYRFEWFIALLLLEKLNLIAKIKQITKMGFASWGLEPQTIKL